MSTIEPLIAYQYCSPPVYERMRETLVCQGSLFDWVLTEADLTTPDEATIATIEKIVKRCREQTPQDVNSYMFADGSSDRPPTGRHFAGDRDESLSPFSNWQSEADQFVLMVSDAWGVLLRAEAIEGDAEDTVAKDAVAYRVGLTFDETAIAQFAVHLQETVASRISVGQTEIGSTEIHIDPQHLLDRKHTTPGDSDQHSLHSHSLSPNALHLHQRPMLTQPHQAVSAKAKLMAQETFVLSWAKQMASSPKISSRHSLDALKTQVQQSLLLDRVVTQIRHSLDLPDILETTVLEVREFLSADRLVLYQFDRSMATTMASKRSSTQRRSQVGRSIFSGHVTYEAKASEKISSVLYSAEEKCFTPSRLQRARFLSGRPIAVDSVDEQYAQTACLLEFLKKAQVKSKMIAPVVVQGELWALLIAHQCDDYRHWEETEVVFLQHIADHLAVAVSQAQLYHQLQQQTTSLQSRVEQRTQNLHDALMVAETANVTKGEFLSTMSHELRTPLTYIIGMSATLLRWSFGDLSDRQRSYLNTINQSGEQLLDIINNILELAKVESGQRLLEAGEVSLSELCDSVIEAYDDLAQSRQVVLSLDSKLTPDEDLFWADEERLRQVLSNLTENAIKFTPEQGTVNLIVWREPQQVLFQIEDTGIGIAESQQDSLFEKFKQLESPFSRQYPGAGIGLAMTKHLVEMHSGTIQVESQVGSGSTFTVCLPVRPKIQHGFGDAIPNTLSNKKRVILLEQDEESAAIVCNMLTAAGYEVIWLLESGALESQLMLLKPIVLLADLSLLSSDPRQIKSLQLSIADLDAKVLALLSSGAPSSSMAHHDVLTKPIEPKRLLDKVRQLSPISQ